MRQNQKHEITSIYFSCVDSQHFKKTLTDVPFQKCIEKPEVQGLAVSSQVLMPIEKWEVTSCTVLLIVVFCAFCVCLLSCRCWCSHNHAVLIQ